MAGEVFVELLRTEFCNYRKNTGSSPMLTAQTLLLQKNVFRKNHMAPHPSLAVFVTRSAPAGCTADCTNT